LFQVIPELDFRRILACAVELGYDIMKGTLCHYKWVLF